MPVDGQLCYLYSAPGTSAFVRLEPSAEAEPWWRVITPTCVLLSLCLPYCYYCCTAVVRGLAYKQREDYSALLSAGLPLVGTPLRLYISFGKLDLEMRR